MATLSVGSLQVGPAPKVLSIGLIEVGPDGGPVVVKVEGLGLADTVSITKTATSAIVLTVNESVGLVEPLDATVRSVQVISDDASVTTDQVLGILLAAETTLIGLSDSASLTLVPNAPVDYTATATDPVLGSDGVSVDHVVALDITLTVTDTAVVTDTGGVFADLTEAKSYEVGEPPVVSDSVSIDLFVVPPTAWTHTVTDSAVTTDRETLARGIRHRILRTPVIKMYDERPATKWVLAPWDQGQSVWKRDGIWTHGPQPNDRFGELCEHFFRGGYDHEVDDILAEELISHGYEVQDRFTDTGTTSVQVPDTSPVGVAAILSVSGMTVVGPSALEAITDDDPGTYLIGEAGAVLEVRLGEVPSVPPGHDLIVVLGTLSGSGTVVLSLYYGDDLISTLPGVTVTETPIDREVGFPYADLQTLPDGVWTDLRLRIEFS